MTWCPPISSSTRPAAAPGSPHGWRSGATERPREETVDVGIAYASQQLQVPDGLLAEKVVVAGASREHPVGVGMLFYEDGNWNVTAFGIAKVEPPQTFAQILDLVDEILPAHFVVRAAAGHPARRDGVPQVPDQSVAPL